MFGTKKKLKIQMNNNKILNEQNQNLRKENINYQAMIKEMKIVNNDFSKMIDEYSIKINDLKKEIKVLKSLLTKNGINYKKEDKKSGK